MENVLETNVVPFEYDSAEIRTVKDEVDGSIWFVAKDICDVLGIVNARKAVSVLDDDEKNNVPFSYGKRGNPNMNIINESGLYTLILRSNKPEAKPFRKWVTSEVLPSIRKTGTYEVGALTPVQQNLKNAQMMVALEEKQEAISNRQIESESRITRLEAMGETDTAYFSITGYANILGIKLPDFQAQFFGKQAAKLSKRLGVPISKVRHERWGHVGTYHESILEEIMGD